jgi:mevalonate kinase
VLNGAKALAVPLRFGQELKVEDNGQGFILWQSFAYDGSEWFSGKYSLHDFSIIESSNHTVATYPQRLMISAHDLNPSFCRGSKGCNVISTLNYPLLWGLGSSSTLIAAVAGWAGINPFQLHFKVSGGSGYDIACAVSNGPVVYTLLENQPIFERVVFNPSFSDKIFFVYQGNKQDSAEGINKFLKRNPDAGEAIVKEVSILTDRMLKAVSLTEFEAVMLEHEALISSMLDMPPIKETLFIDLPGEVKSLGAWGGDFCMLTWRNDPKQLAAYLKSKGLEIKFNFSDIVL